MARKITKIIIINFLGFAVGLFILELLFGNWLRPNRTNRLHLITGVELKYDAASLYQSGDTQVIYRRDRYGLRGDYGRTDGIDLLTVGGSATDQRYITEGATWQDVLQQDFLSNGTVVHIANAGVDGQSTFGHIKNFDWWFPEIPDLKARYVLYYVGVNDFYRDEGDPFDGFSDHPQLTLTYFSQQIVDNSALYQLYRTASGIYAARRRGVAHRRVDFGALRWTDRPEATDHEALMRARLQDYGGRLRILDERTRKLGAVPIYVTQPVARCKCSDGKVMGVEDELTFDGVNINGADVCLMMQLLNKKTLETCRDVGGVCLDLAGEQEFDDGDFYDYYHNTPQGAAKVGHYLYQRLKYLFPHEKG